MPVIDEGELETLIHQYGRGPIQPRSGPYMDTNLERGMFSSYRELDSFRETGREKPSFHQKSIQDELKSGQIPISVHETYRLINTDDPVAVDFQIKMAAITQRLFKGNYGAKTHDFRFLLSDVDDPEACILTGAQPPIVVISKGAIEKFETEDELAAAIAHELTHQHIFDRIGAHANSNPEESSADAWAVNLLQEAGYNPNAMLTMLEKVYPSYSRHRKTAIEAKEPHPSYPTRRRHVEDVLAYFESKKPLNSQLTPLDLTLKNSVTSVRHVALVDAYLDNLDYEKISPEEQVDILCRLWDEELIKLSFDEHKTRFDAFENRLSALAVIVQKTPRVLDPLLRRVLLIPYEGFMKGDYISSGYKDDRIESLYKALSRGYGAHQERKYGWTPIGPLAYLKTAMTCFIQAESAEDAQAHAEIINTIGSYLSISRSPIVSNIRWPDFEVARLLTLDQKLKAGEVCALPWNNLSRWSEGSSEIRQALGRFNINDSGIPEVEESQRIILKPIEWKRYGYVPTENLSFDPNGHITGHNIKRVKREIPKERRFSRPNDDSYLLARDREADDLLKTIDFNFMENDFWGFVDRYKDQLTPQITTSEGGDKFQKIFCEKCHELRKKDPEKYTLILNEFFLEVPEEETEGKNKKSTFPRMLEEFRRSFGISAEVRPYDSWLGEGRKAIIRVQHGLSINTSYIQFALHQLDVPVKDKFRLMSQSRWRSKKGNNPEDLIDFDFRSIFQYEKPQSTADLYKVIEHLNDICGDKNHDPESRLCKAIINVEIYSYLKLQRNEALDIEKLSAICGQSTKDIESFFDKDFVLGFLPNEILDEENAKIHTNQYARLLDRQIEHLFADNASEEKTAPELVENYQILCFGSAQRTSFFDRKPKERAKYESQMRGKIDKIDNPVEKTKLLRTLLCKSDLKDPDFRVWAVNEWTRSQGQIIRENIPTGDKTLSDIKALTADIIVNARMGQSVGMLNGLLEEIQAQEDVAFIVRDKIIDHFLRTGTKGNFAAAANDYVLERIGDEPKIRENLLEFLTSPLTEETTNAFVKSLTNPDLNRKYSKDFFYIFQHDRDEKGIEIPKETRIQALHNIHRNFWALPFAARTLYIERVLFPVGEDGEEQFNKAVSYAMDKILPAGQLYMDHARLVLATHLEQCSKPLQRLVFSALITASEARDNPEAKLRPGQILSQVLSRSGAAGGKILQAIHSYLQSIPDPDEDIIQFREDLKSSKSNYNKPFRWDMLKRVKDCYKPRGDRSAPTIGNQLGAGSYGYTVELVYPEKPTALTLAREDVAEESHYQFGIFRKTAEKLSQINQMWKPLIGILSNAQSMSAVESDFEIAANQIKVAETLYNGLSVSVDGYNFNISTASLQHFGKNFKETELAAGEHFLDLPNTTKEQKKYRRAVAKAVAAVEMHIWMRGGAYDYDRHGAQCRVKGSSIKMFDHGSIPYDIEKCRVIIPTTQNKILLGQIIAEAYKESQATGVSIADALVEKLTQIESYGDSQNYLECFKRGMLALNDYIQDVADTPEEKNQFIREVILQSVRTGLADEYIVRSAIGNMPSEQIFTNESTEHSFALCDSRSSMPKRFVSLLSLAFSRTALGSWYHGRYSHQTGAVAACILHQHTVGLNN